MLPASMPTSVGFNRSQEWEPSRGARSCRTAPTRSRSDAWTENPVSLAYNHEGERKAQANSGVKNVPLQRSHLTLSRREKITSSNVHISEKTLRNIHSMRICLEEIHLEHLQESPDLPCSIPGRQDFVVVPDSFLMCHFSLFSNIWRSGFPVLVSSVKSFSQLACHHGPGAGASPGCVALESSTGAMVKLTARAALAGSPSFPCSAGGFAYCCRAGGAPLPHARL